MLSNADENIPAFHASVKSKSNYSILIVFQITLRHACGSKHNT